MIRPVFFVSSLFLKMEHSSVLTLLSTAHIGFFRFYFILLTLSSRSRTNLISYGVLYLNIPIHIFATNIRCLINRIIVKG